MGPDKIKNSTGTSSRIQADGHWNEMSLNIVWHELPWSGSWPFTLVYLYKSEWHGTAKLDIFNVFKLVLGTAVAQWLRCCATNRKVAGSIPAGVIGFFIDIKSFWSHYGPGVDLASNRNEYQEYFLGLKAAGA